jgi:hypothetical protein
MAAATMVAMELWILGFLQRLNARRKRQGKKGKEEERPLNRFITTVKMRPTRPA